MEMGSSGTIGHIDPKGEIYECPTCNYKDGFHLSFKMKGASGTGEIILICPNCHSRFKLGWCVTIEDF